MHQQESQQQNSQQPQQQKPQLNLPKEQDQASAIKQPSQHTSPKYKATSRTVVHEPAPKDAGSPSIPDGGSGQETQEQVPSETIKEHRTTSDSISHLPDVKSRMDEDLSKVTKGDTATRMPSDSDHLKGPEDDVQPLSPPPTAEVGELN